MISPPLLINLSEIEACSTLTPAALAYLREAAAVVLERLHPTASPDVDARIEPAESDPRDARLRWLRPEKQQIDTHANDNNASEDGASAVAIVTVWRSRGYKVVKRAYHGSGADYLMRKEGAEGDEFIRLEVSGILGKAHPGTRIREKVNELRGGSLKRPGVAVVVAFPGTPVRILMEDVP